MPSEARTLAQQACLLIVISASLVLGGMALANAGLVPRHEVLLTLVSPAGSAAAACCGLGLLGAIKGWRGLRLACAVFIVAIGCYSMARAWLSWSWLQSLPAVSQYRAPYPLAGALLVLIGSCLALGLQRPRVVVLWRLTGGLAMVIGFGLLLAQWHWPVFAWLAPHPVPATMSSLALGLYGVALVVATLPVAAEPRVGWTGWAVGVLGVALSSIGWYYLSADHMQQVRQQGRQTITNVQQSVTQVLGREIQQLERLNDRWDLFAGGPPALVRDADLYALLRDITSLEGMASIRPDGQPLWIQTRHPRVPSWEDLLADPAVQAWLAPALLRPELQLVPRLVPDTAGPVLGLLRLPQRDLLQSRPGLVAILNFTMLLNQHLQVSLWPFALDVGFAPGHDVVLGDLGQASPLHLVLDQAPLVLPFGPTVTLRLALADHRGLQQAAHLRLLMFVIGLLLSFFLVISVELSRTMVARSRSLESSRLRQARIGGIAQHIARGDAPADTLAELCRMLAGDFDGARLAALAHDPADHRLSLLASAGLPVGLAHRLEHPRSLPTFASARQASTTGRLVCLEAHEAWPRAVAMAAVWAYPVLDAHGVVLGVLELYWPAPDWPAHDQVEALITPALRLMALALERQRDLRRIADNEQRYRSLFTYNPDAVFALDPRGHFTDANATVCGILERQLDQILGRHFTDMLEADDWSAAIVPFSKALAGEPHRYDFVARTRSGRTLAFDMINLPIVIDGRITGVHGIAKDITDKRRRDAEMQLLLRSVEASSNGIVLANARQADMPIEYVNPAFERITGYARSEVLGSNCRLLQGPATDPAALAEIRQGLAAQREVHTTLLNYRKDGMPFWNDLYLAPVRDERGQVTHFIGVQNDISNLKAQEAQLAHHAHHDALTSLPNRALLQDRLTLSCQMARRHGSHLAVIFIDLDGFKPINDSLGHAVGDSILIEVAARLAALASAGDTVARFGGDEFVMVVTSLATPDALQPLLDRILTEVARVYRHEQRELFITCSLGVVFSDGRLDDPAELIRQADMAMYRAKEQGRNNYQWYTAEINARLAGQLALRHDLQAAIEQHQFVLHYQPIFDAQGRVRSAEALVRWNHPERGWVSPGSFIPLAEQTGQIIPISDWVIGQVCRDLIQLPLPDDFRISVNISPLQFHRPTFLPQLMQQLREHDVVASRLEVEVTEGVLMTDSAFAIATLGDLRAAGVSVAIDDFGTGFSSLSYLKRLPIDRIKIDRSFIQDVVHDTHDAAITHGIIVMAHQLGLEVVAEGIETEAQQEFVVRHGCDLLQGYHLARPADLDALRLWLWPPAPTSD